jgi:hypothetical protein
MGKTWKLFRKRERNGIDPSLASTKEMTVKLEKVLAVWLVWKHLSRFPKMKLCQLASDGQSFRDTRAPETGFKCNGQTGPYKYILALNSSYRVQPCETSHVTIPSVFTDIIRCSQIVDYEHSWIQIRIILCRSTEHNTSLQADVVGLWTFHFRGKFRFGNSRISQDQESTCS